MNRYDEDSVMTRIFRCSPLSWNKTDSQIKTPLRIDPGSFLAVLQQPSLTACLGPRQLFIRVTRQKCEMLVVHISSLYSRLLPLV